MNLGLRSEWQDCPTRVNPAVKKQVARPEENKATKGSKAHIVKHHKYSISQLTMEMGINSKAFAYRAEKLIGKKSTNDLTDDEVLMVYNDLKSKKVKRPMKRKGK